MKKPLFILMFAAAVSPVLDAKVYSCGAGCYSDKASGSHGYANLGKQIGSYTNFTAQIADDNNTAQTQTPPQEVQIANTNIRSKPAPVQAMAHPTPVKHMPLNNIAMPTPAVAIARPKATPNLTKFNGRRSILEQELSNERGALAAAQKALAEGRTVANGKSDNEHQAKVRQLESAVLDRQQNIQALQRELSRM